MSNQNRPKKKKIIVKRAIVVRKRTVKKKEEQKSAPMKEVQGRPPADNGITFKIKVRKK